MYALLGMYPRLSSMAFLSFFGIEIPKTIRFSVKFDNINRRLIKYAF